MPIEIHGSSTANVLTSVLVLQDWYFSKRRRVVKSTGQVRKYDGRNRELRRTTRVKKEKTWLMQI